MNFGFVHIEKLTEVQNKRLILAGFWLMYGGEAPQPSLNWLGALISHLNYYLVHAKTITIFNTRLSQKYLT